MFAIKCCNCDAVTNDAIGWLDCGHDYMCCPACVASVGDVADDPVIVEDQA